VRAVGVVVVAPAVGVGVGTTTWLCGVCESRSDGFAFSLV